MWIFKINLLPQVETTYFQPHLQAKKEMEVKGKKMHRMDIKVTRTNVYNSSPFFVTIHSFKDQCGGWLEYYHRSPCES
jgi:hypothetical protein